MAAGRLFFVVPKLRLGMRPREALLRIFDSFFYSGFTPPIEIRQAELGKTHSQAELGNDRMGIFFLGNGRIRGFL